MTIKTIQSDIHAKSLTHTVIPLADRTFQIVSGSSHLVYIVTPIEGQKGAICNCGGGLNRNTDNSASGCSHVMSVYGYLARVLHPKGDTSAWITKDEAAGLHQAMVDLGNNITDTVGMTFRLRC